MNSKALVELINEHHRPGQYSYVLLDPLAVSEDSEHSALARLKSVLGDSAMTRVVRPDLPLAPGLHPVLVCLGSPGSLPDAALLALTAQAAEHDMHRRKRQVCGWLLSEAPPSAIASHLTALCRLPEASGATSIHPVYEPLRLELLAALYERAEQGPWWPIERWVFVTSGGSLASLKGQPRNRRGLPAGAIGVQQDAALIEAVLAAWRTLPALPGAREFPPFAAVRASNHIDDARGLGLKVEQDILVMAFHLLRLHPRLHTQKAVREMIEVAIRQQRPLAEMFAHFSDSSWQRLVAATPQPEAYP
ncbi:hypothetical protein [Pseudomonas sp. CC120222-01a]|uniref:hypothetical protein n=1 Tax=Pseudomonas sp. CC120222-01a TaxID=1378075 RepID=UPI000D896CD3|nr:hypothetical protein [Pseudomonas sp. CC120222-01a]PVZ38904.1 hypothetical protein N430_04060 [Pseudomonas sp. CC120222-01a]